MTPLFADEFANLSATWWTKGMFHTDQAREGTWRDDQIAYFDRANISAWGGRLRIKASVAPSRLVDGRNYDWSTGILQTRGKVALTPPCRVEAKVFLPGKDGKIWNWPAVWMLGDHGEIDIVEGLHGQAAYHFHPIPRDGTDGPLTSPGAAYHGVNTGWHIWGCDWRVGKIEFFRDRVSAGVIESDGIIADPMYLILAYAVGGFGGPATASTMLVEWIRAQRLEENAHARS